MKIRLASPITRDSIVDGPGLRAVIWAQGCFHHCPGCHNPCTHNPFGGFEMDTADVIEQIRSLRLQKGITLSGGEPFLQPLPLAEIARAARLRGLDHDGKRLLYPRLPQVILQILRAQAAVER